MAFYPGLRPLREVLAEIYTTPDEARVVVGDAGLREHRIDFSGSATTFWTRVLSVAQSSGKVQAVIDVVRRDYADNEALVAAEQVFHATPAPDPVVGQDDDAATTGSTDAMTVSVGGENTGIIGRDISNASVVNAGDISGDGNTIVSGSGNVVQRAEGNNIAQASPGGSATVNDHASHSVFDQRGQQVETQVNIAGDYNPAYAQDRAAATAELHALLDEINRARAAGALDADTATDAGYQVTKALNQAETPEPDKPAMLDYLNKAKQIIAAAAAAAGLVTAIAEAVRMVQRVF